MGQARLTLSCLSCFLARRRRTWDCRSIMPWRTFSYCLRARYVRIYFWMMTAFVSARAFMKLCRPNIPRAYDWWGRETNTYTNYAQKLCTYIDMTLTHLNRYDLHMTLTTCINTTIFIWPWPPCIDMTLTPLCEACCPENFEKSSDPRAILGYFR